MVCRATRTGRCGALDALISQLQQTDKALKENGRKREQTVRLVLDRGAEYQAIGIGLLDELDKQLKRMEDVKAALERKISAQATSGPTSSEIAAAATILGQHLVGMDDTAWSQKLAELNATTFWDGSDWRVRFQLDLARWVIQLHESPKGGLTGRVWYHGDVAWHDPRTPAFANPRVRTRATRRRHPPQCGRRLLAGLPLPLQTFFPARRTPGAVAAMIRAGIRAVKSMVTGKGEAGVASRNEHKDPGVRHLGDLLSDDVAANHAAPDQQDGKANEQRPREVHPSSVVPESPKHGAR